MKERSSTVLKLNTSKVLICLSLGLEFLFATFHTLSAQHSFYAGGNLKIAPFDNIIEVKQMVDPVEPDISRYRINPTVSFKMGYSYGLELVNRLKLNAGLELNQRRHSSTYYYDSIPINNPYHIHIKGNNNYYNLEIPLSLSFLIEKVRVSGGVNMIFLDLRYLKYFSDDGNVSRYSSLGYFPRLESAHFIFPFFKLDYQIHTTQRLSYFVSSAVEIREYQGRTISVSIIIEL